MQEHLKKSVEQLSLVLEKMTNEYLNCEFNFSNRGELTPETLIEYHREMIYGICRAAEIIGYNCQIATNMSKNKD